MRERVGKLLIGFVAMAIFIGMAETSADYAKKQDQHSKQMENITAKNEHKL
jgi:hypothetical protein